MAPPRPRLLIWTGPGHSGKTTAATQLAEWARGEGFPVAGILAPAVYDGDVLIGFDALDIHTMAGVPLARRKPARPAGRNQTGRVRPDGRADAGQENKKQHLCCAEGGERAGPFGFTAQGLEFGNAVLNSTAARLAALLIIDEFGPLELRGGGWRQAADSLIPEAQGVVLLVVRKELAAQVGELYSTCCPQVLSALQPDSIQKVQHLIRQLCKRF